MAGRQVDRGADHAPDPSARGVQPGSPSILGSLPRDSVVDPLSTRLPDLNRCYDSLLEREPEAAGSYTAKFVINPDGVVSKSFTLDSTVPDTGFRDCMAQAIRTAVFAPPPDGAIVIVTYPLALRP